MERFKTYDSTGIAPDGKLYAGDLNLFQDLVAALADFSQTIQAATYEIGDTGVVLSNIGSDTAQISAALAVTGVLLAQGGISIANMTTTARDALTLPDKGMVIFNTTTGQLEVNTGTSGTPAWSNIRGGLVNADVASGAAIAYSKLALGNSIVNADVASGAAIGRSKLDFGSGLVNADIATAAAIAYAKLALTASIVNADVASGAAIAYSKLALGNSIVNADISTSAAIGISKLAGYPSDATKVLKGNGTWGTVTKAAVGGSLGTYTLDADAYSAAGQNAMLGMGLLITPSLTGKVVCVLESSLAGGWVNVAAHFQWRYGTGTPPANNAAVAGTAVGGAIYRGTGGQENNRHFGHCFYLSGLTPGTQYWFDLQMIFDGDPQDGQTPGISDGSYFIEEVG